MKGTQEIVHAKSRNNKKILVLVNPKAGSGNAWKIFEEIKWIFDVCSIKCDPFRKYPK